jgi:hypothetical protein
MLCTLTTHYMNTKMVLSRALDQQGRAIASKSDSAGQAESHLKNRWGSGVRAPLASGTSLAESPHKSTMLWIRGHLKTGKIRRAGWLSQTIVT